MAKAGVKTANAPLAHGADQLPLVEVLSYNLEIRDDEGFIGDKANRQAFFDILDQLREDLSHAEDPLDTPTDELSKKAIDALLQRGDLRESSLIHSAVEEFAQRLAQVARRFLRVKAWADVRRVIVGGGFSDSRVGELAIGRASLLLQREGRDIELTPIRFDPDEAGLIGCAHLAPSWIFDGYDCVLTADIGGTNMRCGVVTLEKNKSGELVGGQVWKSEIWRHAEDEPARHEAVNRLGEMLADLVSAAKKKKKKLAPFFGVGCPGVIRPDGSIDRGAQNLPGDWSDDDFNLVSALKDLIPEINGHETMIVLHNDAVVQGLSEAPNMRDADRWGVLTIGTGLGNASFANRASGG